MSYRQYTALVTREGDVWSGFVYGVPGPVLRRTLDELYSEPIAGVAVMTSTFDEPIMLTLAIAPQGVGRRVAGHQLGTEPLSGCHER